MNIASRPTARANGLIVQEVNGEILIYDSDTHKAACLNETAAIVWQHCDGTNDVHDIATLLSKKTRQPVADEVVMLAVQELASKSLLTEGPVTFTSFAGISRRDLIKKVGLGATIALPVVAALVAPPAIHSASACVNTGTACTCSGANGGSGNACTEAGAPVCGRGCVCRWNNNGNSSGTCSA